MAKVAKKGPVKALIIKRFSFFNAAILLQKSGKKPHLNAFIFACMNPMEEQGQQMEIELSEEMAEGTYTNLAIITHSNAEFVVDFVRLMPGVPKARVKSRVVMSPLHAKRLLLALGDNLAKYEESFGEIDIQDQGPGFHLPLNFGGQTGQA
jgi:hypothetical protein